MLRPFFSAISQSNSLGLAMIQTNNIGLIHPIRTAIAASGTRNGPISEVPVSILKIVSNHKENAILKLVKGIEMRNHSKQIFEPVDALATTKECRVLAPILALIENIAKRDKKAILETLLPDGCTTIIRNGKASQFNLSELADRLPGGTRKIEERISDPIVLIDDDIAMVWAHYEFLVEGEVEQYGTDLFNLILCDQRWLISGITYNSHNNRQSGAA